MKSKWVIGLVFGAVITVLIVTAFTKTANYILGAALVSIFEKETGCAVTLERPRIHYFPLRAEVSNIAIRHRDEGAGEGFFASHLETRASLSDVFHKVLRLNDLVISGVRTVTRKESSGFINTIDFIAADPVIPKHRPWHAWLSLGWKVQVADVTLQPEENEKQNFLLELKGSRLAAEKLRVSFLRREESLPLIFDSTFHAANVFYGEDNFDFSNYGALDAAVVFGGGKLELKKAALRNPTLKESDPSKLEAYGEIQFEGEGEYRIQVNGDYTAEQFAALLPTVKRALADASPNLNVAAMIGGKLTHPTLSGTIRSTFERGLQFGSRDGCTINHFESEFFLDEHGFALSQLHAEPFHEVLGGGVTFDDAFPLRATLKINPEQAPDFFDNCFGAPIPGTQKNTLWQSGLSAELTGTLQPVDVEVRVASESGFTSEIQFSGTKSKILLDDTLKNSGANGLAKAEAEYDRETGKFRIDRAEFRNYPVLRLVQLIGPAVPALQTLSAFIIPETLLTLQYTVDHAHGGERGDGTVKIEKLQLASAPIDELNARFGLDTTGEKIALAVPEYRVRAGSGVFSGDFGLSSAGLLSGKGKLDSVPLNTFDFFARHFPALESRATGNVTYAGSVTRPQIDATLEVASSSDIDRRLRDPSRFVFRLLNDQWTGDVALFGTRATAKISLPKGEEKLFVEGTFDDFPLGSLLADSATEQKDGAENSTGAVTDGISGGFSFRGPLGDPLSGAGFVRFDSVQVNLNGYELRQEAPFRWELASGTLGFGSTALLFQDKKLILSGNLDRKRGWNAHLHGTWELAALLGEITGMEQMSGTLVADIGVSGDPSAPSLSGPLRIEHGSLSLPLGRTVVGAEDIALDASFNGTSLEINSMVADIGDGDFSAKGSISKIFDGSEREFQIDANLNGVQGEPIENFSIVIDGDLAISRVGNAPWNLGGDLVIREGEYQESISLQEIISSVTRAVVGANRPRTFLASGNALRRRSATQPVALEVRVRAADSLVVDTSVFKAELQGDLRIEGTSERPTVDGSVSAIEGVFGLRSNQFEIVRGAAVFSRNDPQIDPRLDIVSESQIVSDGDSYLVRLNIGGTITKPKVQFDSDGGLSSDEIVGILGGGGGLNRVSLLNGSRANSQRIGTLLSTDSNVTFEERFSGLTGFTSVEVGPSFSKTTGEYVPKLFARRPMLGKLDLDIATELGGDERSTVGFDYKLSAKTSVSAGWQNLPVTTSAGTSSGSFNIGAHYTETFPGFKIIPPRQSEEIKRTLNKHLLNRSEKGEAEQ